MKYPLFERLALVLGTIAVLATLAFSLDSAPTAEEIVAQLLMIPVLAGAIHWGRRGGFAAAAAASLVYIVMRVPMVTAAHGLNLDIAILILSRVLAYGLIGIVGGELCARIMYVFARLEDSSRIDHVSGVFNQRAVSTSLATSIGQHLRYDTPFSVVMIKIDARVFEGLRTTKKNQIIRHIAAHLRNDVRLVDEVGRLDDGVFIVLLPQTPSTGALVVRERLERGVRETIAARIESVRATMLAAPDDLEKLQVLRDQLTGGDDNETPVSSEAATTA